jgi:hypothetical protein
MSDVDCFSKVFSEIGDFKVMVPPLLGSSPSVHHDYERAPSDHDKETELFFLKNRCQMIAV